MYGIIKNDDSPTLIQMQGLWKGKENEHKISIIKDNPWYPYFNHM
jgi:hypothetical protein